MSSSWTFPERYCSAWDVQPELHRLTMALVFHTRFVKLVVSRYTQRLAILQHTFIYLADDKSSLWPDLRFQSEVATPCRKSLFCPDSSLADSTNWFICHIVHDRYAQRRNRRILQSGGCHHVDAGRLQAVCRHWIHHRFYWTKISDIDFI